MQLEGRPLRVGDTARCYDRLTLSDGTVVRWPWMVVIDGQKGRETAIGDVAKLITRIKDAGMAVQLTGRDCESECQPFLLWASEPPR
jgi:hypothetical protein